MKLDKYDLKILEMLKRDGELTSSKMGKNLGIPITTVHNRVKRLKDKGIIKRFTIEVDDEKLGYFLKAYILVNVNSDSEAGADQKLIIKNLQKYEEVESASIVTGTIDILLKVRIKDVPALNNFLLERLRPIKGIGNTQTLVIIS